MINAITSFFLGLLFGQMGFVLGGFQGFLMGVLSAFIIIFLDFLIDLHNSKEVEDE